MDENPFQHGDRVRLRRACLAFYPLGHPQEGVVRKVYFGAVAVLWDGQATLSRDSWASASIFELDLAPPPAKTDPRKGSQRKGRKTEP